MRAEIIARKNSRYEESLFASSWLRWSFPHRGLESQTWDDGSRVSDPDLLRVMWLAAPYVIIILDTL